MKKAILILSIFIFALQSCEDSSNSAMNLEEFYSLKKSEQLNKYFELSSDEHFLIWEYKLNQTLHDDYWSEVQKQKITYLISVINPNVFKNKIFPKEIKIKELESVFNYYELEFLLRSIEIKYNPGNSYALKNFSDTIEPEKNCHCNKTDNGVKYKDCSETKTCKKVTNCNTTPFGCGFIWLKPCDGICSWN